MADEENWNMVGSRGGRSWRLELSSHESHLGPTDIFCRPPSTMSAGLFHYGIGGPGDRVVGCWKESKRCNDTYGSPGKVVPARMGLLTVLGSVVTASSRSGVSAQCMLKSLLSNGVMGNCLNLILNFVTVGKKNDKNYFL